MNKPTLDEIIDNLTVGHIGWAHDQLDGTSFIAGELKLIEEREKEAKQQLTQLIREIVTVEILPMVGPYIPEEVLQRAKERGIDLD